MIIKRKISVPKDHPVATNLFRILDYLKHLIGSRTAVFFVSWIVIVKIYILFLFQPPLRSVLTALVSMHCTILRIAECTHGTDGLTKNTEPCSSIVCFHYAQRGNLSFNLVPKHSYC